MADIELLVLAGGVQTGWDLHEEPPPPASFAQLPNRVLRSRARDAWRAAHRLRTLTELWTRVLTMGMMRCRLDAETERQVGEQFPDLSSIGSILEGLARTIEWPEELREPLQRFDQEHGLRRCPAPGHTVDAEPRPFRLMAFEELRRRFLELVQTEAQCLQRLEVNVEQFRRPWGEIRQDAQALFALDQDWAATPSVIHFGPALRSPTFQRARATFLRGSKELVDLLATHPGAALERPAEVTSRPGGKQRGSLPGEQVNELVMEYLRKKHNATSPEIAKKVGCAPSAVRKTAAWKVVSRKRREKKAGPRAGDCSERAVERAEEKTARERHQLEEEARTRALDGEDPEGSACRGLDDHSEKPRRRSAPPAEESLAELIAEQARDMRKDKRRARRK
jgi:hypothetical protein